MAGPKGESSSLRAWTTGVSNPLRWPRFRTSASVKHQRIACAFGVPSGICEFNLYSRNSTLLLLTPVYPFCPQTPSKAGEFKRGYDSIPPTCPLRPVIANNARPPRITAAAGTEFMLSTGFPRHRLYLHLSCAPCLFYFFTFFLSQRKSLAFIQAGVHPEKGERHAHVAPLKSAP